ncbi:MAG: glycine/sarcosine/betaine reductase component B subunit, partial [bacterium]|nr:glycine/sarcosine/betaine reductase component B subunit [bacterium]
ILIPDMEFAGTSKIDPFDSTQGQNGTLFIDANRLKEILAAADSRIETIECDIARPGESTRIIPVKDVIEPRIKADGSGIAFPGLISGTELVGTGTTLALKGLAVTTVGPIVGFQEGLIDMSGPGAEYSVFSKLVHLVLDIKVREGLTRYEHEEVLRFAGLRAAKFLAEIGIGAAIDEIEIFPVPEIFPSVEEEQYSRAMGIGATKPRIAYLYMLQSQGLLHDTYYCGVDVKKILPTLISPTEIFDGAIVSGNCVSACDKNTTWHHQNNPVIAELLRRHGRDLYFCGCVITNENVTLADKKRSSVLATRLIASLKPDGVIISKEGFGNPDADLTMNCQKIEELGIKTVSLTDEYAGQDGASQSLADITPEENAIVSTGNANELITLPAMEKIIGSPDIITKLTGGSPKS